MNNEQLAPAGTRVTFSLLPDSRVALAQGFDWVVDPLRVSLSLIPIGEGCGVTYRGLPATLSPVDTGSCGPGLPQVQLKAHLIAPQELRAFRAVFVIEGVDRPELALELEAGQLFVTSSVRPPRRGQCL